ncbi:MAG: hypothetical protein Q3M24_14450 [Candidatus Electrothrix aestuarii]|uniref:Uncharacterized protein n=1 Tax=Candidatus Electrothrix aestuarii TaxID=3062594 RepID=A0AAU8LQR9_9BACT|nr:hypothetical protein [Candidatus Electrothrix aestuarii]
MIATKTSLPYLGHHSEEVRRTRCKKLSEKFTEERKMEREDEEGEKILGKNFKAGNRGRKSSHLK